MRALISIISASFITAICVTPVFADSSSPRLAAYYDLHLVICSDSVYEWYDDDSPRKSLSDMKQVGVGKNNRYALTTQGKLVMWTDDPENVTELMDNVTFFSAGKTGIFIILTDDSLWKFDVEGVFGFGEKISAKPHHIANNVLTAAIGDSANYYVTQSGALMVRGLAHRGQYGDGKLTSTEDFIQTASHVVQVVSHTGHVLLLTKQGEVLGSGGNIYGPLGQHGYGDKAVRWGHVFDKAIGIATGSSHSLAIKADKSLWIWGRNEGLDPKKIMTNVDAVAAGNDGSIALSNNALWQWETGEKPQKVMDCF